MENKKPLRITWSGWLDRGPGLMRLGVSKGVVINCTLSKKPYLGKYSTRVSLRHGSNAKQYKNDECQGTIEDAKLQCERNARVLVKQHLGGTQ